MGSKLKRLSRFHFDVQTNLSTSVTAMCFANQMELNWRMNETLEPLNPETCMPAPTAFSRTFRILLDSASQKRQHAFCRPGHADGLRSQIPGPVPPN
ncbi:MAG: hypothetical protein LW816_21010, partial [Planctomyces sp.]|nr:hypothetical protein [Planctomyces sp.]